MANRRTMLQDYTCVKNGTTLFMHTNIQTHPRYLFVSVQAASKPLKGTNFILKKHDLPFKINVLIRIFICLEIKFVLDS